MTGTPNNRLKTVERHAYTIQALAESLDAMSSFAHQNNRTDLGFLLGFLADRLHQEADAIITAATAQG